MTRTALPPCPVNCGRTRLRWQAECGACWSRLPADMRGAISRARAAKARHLEAKAAIAATAWLQQHAPAELSARVLGEAG